MEQKTTKSNLLKGDLRDNWSRYNNPNTSHKLNQQSFQFLWVPPKLWLQ